MSLSRLFKYLAFFLILILSVAIVAVVYLQMKRQALEHAEKVSVAILDRNVAIQKHFLQNIRPEIKNFLSRADNREDFDPTLISTAFFLRQVENLYQEASEDKYFYKEAVIDARVPDNEADPFEIDFIRRLNADPELKVESSIQTFDGAPFFVVLRRGKTLVTDCLSCHGDPEDAPPKLIARYGAERSFYRDLGEVVSAYSIRIPLATAYQEAKLFTLKLSGLLLLALGGFFVLQYYLTRRLIFAPLEIVRDKARSIATDSNLLGERIVKPYGRELEDMVDAFNAMSENLSEQQQHLEKTVHLRTMQLQQAIEEAQTDIERRKKIEKALAELKDQNELILNSVWEGIFRFDINGMTTFINPAAERMLGYRADELVGKNVHDIIHHTDAEGAKHPWEDCPARMSLVNGKVNQSSSGLYWRRNGTSFAVESTSVPIREGGAIVGAVVTFRDITERQKSEDKIRQLAYFDALTGLPNRRLLNDRLEQLIAKLQRNKEMFAVIFIDLDGFKDINDTLGHSVGDRYLQIVAERLKEGLRQSDTLARLGGDEFVFIGSVRDPDGAGIIARKFLETLARPAELEGQQVFSSGSLGISLYPLDGETAETLLMNADAAMYQAKAKGKNTYKYFARTIASRALTRLNLVGELRQALDNSEFVLHYQPQMDIESGRLIGAEALLRWEHPKRGLIPPDQFIPLAEETGLILPLGAWVLRQACQQCHLWEEAGFLSLKMAINISARQFRQEGFVDLLDSVLEETAVNPSLIELEMTESVVMDNADETVFTLVDLKMRGVKLSIDDFGTGYSSLNYLKHFPIDRLKIDQSFIGDLPGNSEDVAITEAIIAMAESLGIRVLAEGVETAEQVEFLRQRKCYEMQGYYFARPMTAEAFEAFLEKYSAAGERVAVVPVSS